MTGPAIRYRARAELRSSWRGAIGLVVLVVLLGSAVLASTAGARRTASAYTRLLVATEAADLLVSPYEDPSDPEAYRAALGDVPGVRAVGHVMGAPILPLAGSAAAALVAEGPNEVESSDLGIPFASVDGVFGFDFGRPEVVAGRMPDPDAVDEVLVSSLLRRRTGLGVGDTLDVVVIDDQERDTYLDAEPADGVPLRLRVTGIGTFTGEVVPVSDLDDQGSLLLTPALAALVYDRGYEPFFTGTFLDLEPGVAAGDVHHRLDAVATDGSSGFEGPLLVVDQTATFDEVQDSIRPLAVALGAFAAIVSILGALVVGQAVARHTRVPADEVAALAAVGLGRRARIGVTVIRAALIGALGAIASVIVAVAVSDRFPFGPARVAEPDPGVRVDGPVLVLGALAIVLVVTAASLPAAIWRSRARRPVPARPSLSARVASSLPVSAVQGVRFAFDRGEGATPVRSTLVAATVASACVLAAATFSMSLDTLVSTPAHYGQGWDRLLDGQFGPVAAGTLVERLVDHPEVEGLSAGSYADVTVEGASVPAVAMIDIEGNAGVTVVRGARAGQPGEIALGGDVLDQVGADLGDTVTVDAGDGPRDLRVVGEVLFPRLTQGSFVRTGLGMGAQLHADDAPPIIDPTEFETEGVPPGMAYHDRLHNFVAVDVAGDAGAIDDLLADLHADGLFFELGTTQPPTVIRDLDRVRTVPLALSGLLALAAAAVLGHLLASTVVIRRRELALLRGLGFVGGQIRSAIAWQATLVSTVALTVGAPLGIAAGRVVWQAFANGVGAPSPAAVPWPWLMIAAPAAVLLANAAAAVPARRASGVTAGTVLRQE